QRDDRLACSLHRGHHSDRHRAAVAFGAGDPIYRLGLFPRRRAPSDRRMSVKLLYFAWVRERVGKTEEVVELPAGLRTVGDVVAWLAGRGEEYAHAFENPKVVPAPIDRTHLRPHA